MSDPARRTGLIKQRQHVLKSLIKSFDRHNSANRDAIFAPQATESEEYEQLDALDFTAGNNLQLIDAAIQRLEHGEYRICVRCGAEIDASRLALQPVTPFCQTCAQ